MQRVASILRPFRLGLVGCCLLFLSCLLAATSAGVKSKSVWHTPPLTPPLAPPATCRTPSERAERDYAQAIEREQQGTPDCVDLYYAAATGIWPTLASQCPMQGTSRAAELYRSALTKLIDTGQRFGRLDPRRGLTVYTPQGMRWLPIHHEGFLFEQTAFGQFEAAGPYQTEYLNRTFASPGLGVAGVVIGTPPPGAKHRLDQEIFAATAILRPRPEATTSTDAFALEFWDPLRRDHLYVGTQRVPLRRDLSAPLAYSMVDDEPRNLTAFLQPGNLTSEVGLFMIEPWQPDKIPVVFVHGLLSDPRTWANMANEVRAQPDLMQRYQIWGFEYTTGGAFLSSAAILRQELAEVYQQSLGTGAPPITDAILVGHSMGGLVAKLQVTSSGDQVWRSVSDVPLAGIETTPQTRAKLATASYFAPSPLVSRVVYMGTPHRGSPYASRPIGKLATALVRQPIDREAIHAQLVRDNPLAFSPEFQRRIPTSVDLLRPDSPLLQSLDRLPVSPRVQQHSIIGTSHKMLFAGPSDGVVPVTSAQKQGTQSEKIIRARHGELHRQPEGIVELFRILRLHAQEVDARRATARRGTESGDRSMASR